MLSNAFCNALSTTTMLLSPRRYITAAHAGPAVPLDCSAFSYDSTGEHSIDDFPSWLSSSKPLAESTVTSAALPFAPQRCSHVGYIRL
jgi:hypothetical protein